MNACKQLQKDLLELERNPIVGANACPIDDNLMKWYGIIVGCEGSPFEGIPIRFLMEFPEDYPNSPPKAFFDTFIAYYGGASHYVNGKLAVCLNIFGNFRHVHDEWKNLVAEGWSSAYSVSTILITMQGLMMSFTSQGPNQWHSDLLSTRKEDIERTIKEAKAYKCSLTQHDGSDPNQWFPKVLLSQNQLVEQMKKLGISNTPSTYDPLKDFYVCYVSKTNVLDGAILGYGIHVENPKNGTLSSTCEYISLDAFKSGTRNSSTNKPFEFWMPILINENNWNQVKPLFMETVIQIAQVIGFEKQSIEIKIVKVCASIMNQLVVEVMNNKNNLTANDKFINGYFSLYRMMNRYCQDDLAISAFVDQELHSFIKGKRSKKFISNLGELLIYLTISKKFTWKDINTMFQEECDARNFMWYAIGNYNNPAKCPELKNSSIVEGRASKVFTATIISRNLVAFQVKFASMAKILSLEIMDSNCGLAPTSMRDDLKNAYNIITKFENWNDYFSYLEIPNITDSERNKQLIRIIQISKTNGYHK